jgi:hypothetical protein
MLHTDEARKVSLKLGNLRPGCEPVGLQDLDNRGDIGVVNVLPSIG